MGTGGLMLFFKYNLLPDFLPQINFGVGCFHAFGHEFACQAIYHPQKSFGFGHTDGEGCERCWGHLQKEIPTLRIAGVSQTITIHPSPLNVLTVLALLPSFYLATHSQIHP